MVDEAAIAVSYRERRDLRNALDLHHVEIALADGRLDHGMGERIDAGIDRIPSSKLVRGVDRRTDAVLVIVADHLLEQINGHVADERTCAPAVLVLGNLEDVGLSRDMFIELGPIAHEVFDRDGAASPMAAWGGHNAPRCENARRYNFAASFLSTQREDEIGVVPRVVDRRYAAIQIAVKRSQPVARRARSAAASEMHVHVHEARYCELARSVEALGARWRVDVLSNSDEAAAIDDDVHARRGGRPGPGTINDGDVLDNEGDERGLAARARWRQCNEPEYDEQGIPAMHVAHHN